jgi:hypothetical protein
MTEFSRAIFVTEEQLMNLLAEAEEIEITFFGSVVDTNISGVVLLKWD